MALQVGKQHLNLDKLILSFEAHKQNETIVLKLSIQKCKF